MSRHSSRSGRQNPLTRLLVESFDQLMRQCMFCLPGRVVLFDPETQLAQIECGIQRLDSEGKGHTIPVIENVPVLFSGDGEWYLFHQITEGTEGLIHFSQRAIDTWMDQGGPVAPHEARLLSEDDAFFVPGVRSKPNAIPGFKNDGAGVSNYSGDTFAHLQSNGTIQVEAADNAVVYAGGDITAEAAGKADVTAPTINLNGDVNITGSLNLTGPLTGQPGAEGGGANFESDVVANGVSLVEHTHSQGPDSDGNNEVQTDAPTATE